MTTDHDVLQFSRATRRTLTQSGLAVSLVWQAAIWDALPDLDADVHRDVTHAARLLFHGRNASVAHLSTFVHQRFTARNASLKARMDVLRTAGVTETHCEPLMYDAMLCVHPASESGSDVEASDGDDDGACGAGTTGLTKRYPRIPGVGSEHGKFRHRHQDLVALSTIATSGTVDYAILASDGSNGVKVCQVELKNMCDYPTAEHMVDKHIAQALLQADAAMPAGAGNWTFCVLTSIEYWLLIRVERTIENKVQ